MKYRLITLLLTIILSGCGQSAFKTGNKTTIIEVQKSPDTIVSYSIEPTGQNLAEAMQSLAIAYETQAQGSRQTITKLQGVVSTASKQWNLYIGNELIKEVNINTITVPDTKTIISWRYEPKN